MENLKFALFSIIIIGALGLAGYWAFSTIESGSSHVDIQKQKQLEQTNIDLGKQVADLTRQVSLLQSEKDAKDSLAEIIADTQATEPVVAPVKTVTPTTAKTTTLKYQSLINELQKLVDGNIYLDSKSEGVAVGSVQKFLNIYNNTLNKVDNDYGPSTITAVKNFQKAQGLTADGEIGPGTFNKMISWLKTK